MLRGWSPNRGAWLAFTPAATIDPHTITCIYPFGATDVTSIVQLAPLTHVTTLLPWTVAAPVTAITPTPPGPARVFKVTHFSLGFYDLHFTQPVAMNSPTASEPNLRAYFAAVPQWTSLITASQISPTVVRFSNVLNSASLTKFVVAGPMQILTSTNGFAHATPITPIP